MIDRIQIRQVVASMDWSNIVSDVINKDLKKVKQGTLTVKGSDIKLTVKYQIFMKFRILQKNLRV